MYIVEAKEKNDNDAIPWHHLPGHNIGGIADGSVALVGD